ncbi:glycosyltransferase [uncultured Kocuria sp.]|uniref:glycosyltransferase n=1 Tax=uncultured Kocuria sp. TaxID=259305 RepID=UPI002632F733|nr:glycosyltransferase [uncultured Kocuria sp.]
MRIALYTDVFVPNVDGVVTRLTRTLDELGDLGHEVLVLTPGHPPEHWGPHRVVRAPSVAFPWYRDVRGGLPSPRVERAVSAFRPDVVHAVNPVWFGAWGALSARARGLPLLASFHTDVPQYLGVFGLGALRRPVERWIRTTHNLAEVTLCTSGPMVERAAALGVRDVALWPKGVDTELFHPAKASPAMRRRLTDGHPGEHLVLSVGRLSKEKSVEALLEPLRRLPGTRLAVVGDGPHRAELERRFAGTPTVFPGRLAGEELAAAYASADVFAFPSSTETLGLVALESLASGVPVVGARAGGIPFAVHDGRTGLLVPPGDADALTHGLVRLLDDAGLRARMGAAGRAEAEGLGWRAATEFLVASYHEAVDRHRSRRKPPRHPAA